MSVLGGDSFDHLTLAQLSRKWDYVGSDVTAVDVAYGRFGSVGLRGRGGFQTIGQAMLGKNIGKTITGWGFMGHAFRIPTMPSQGYYVAHSVYDIANSGGMKFCSMVGADGSVACGYITVNNFSSPLTVIDSSDPGLVVANTWYVIETGFKVASAGGGCIIHLNGVERLNYVGNTNRSQGSNYFIDSSLEQFTHLRIGGAINQPGGGEYTDHDDFWFGDDIDDGILPKTNGFLGDVALGIRRPNGVGSMADFTPSGDTPNWKCVDDITPDDLTTYNHSNTSGQEDLHEFEDVTLDKIIFSLLVNVEAAKDTASAMSYLSRQKPSSFAASTIATRTVPSGFTNQQDVSQVNPATGQRWLPAEFNAAQFGYGLP